MSAIVIKIGGSVLENLKNIVKDMPEGDAIVVHGGAREVTILAESLGIKQRFIISPSGMRSRYTDKKTMEIFQMVTAGKINKEIVRLLEKNGRPAIGLCGLDFHLIRAKRKDKIIALVKGRKILIDGGYTGKITDVNTKFLNGIIAKGITPVIAPVAISEHYEPLNVDADSVAINIANAMNCRQAIFLTDVNGVLDENKKTIREIKLAEISKLKVGQGMKRKLLEISKSHLEEVKILNGLRKNPFSDPVGTIIRR